MSEQVKDYPPYLDHPKPRKKQTTACPDPCYPQQDWNRHRKKAPVSAEEAKHKIGPTAGNAPTAAEAPPGKTGSE